MRLADILENLTKQNTILSRARLAYLSKEAERKHKESTLILASLGKSQAEKTTLAQSTKEWLEFHKELAKKEAIYEYEKFKAEILKLEYQALYLQEKLDAESIRRGEE